MRSCVVVLAAGLVCASCKDTGTGATAGSGSGGPSTIDVRVSVAGSGTITSTPAGIDCGATCSAHFAAGTNVGLSATPAAGWAFSGWSGGCTGTGTCSITASGADVLATFAKLPPTPIGTNSLSVARGGSGGGYVFSQPGGIDCGGICSATYNDGTAVTLTAKADAGSRFAGWGVSCSGTDVCNVTITADTVVTARFDALPPAVDDCSGLLPAAPGTPAQFTVANQDLVNGFCTVNDVDGTGHIAVSTNGQGQPHSSQYTFADPAANIVGTYNGIRLPLIGEASGFMGTECIGASCAQDYVVLDPAGKELYKSPTSIASPGAQANDPTGGIIATRWQDGSGQTVLLIDAIDDGGKVRWTKPIPDTFAGGGHDAVVVGADRKGNVLAIWPSGGHWAAVWFDHDGNVGSVFQAFDGSASPNALYERVGAGLFIWSGSYGPGSSGSKWVGQIEPLATKVDAAPGWLTARPNTVTHMVHGGNGYAILPLQGAAATCEQKVDVISPSGKLCGSQTFSIDAKACATGAIIVGYDGTVVQQLSRDREAQCSAAGHQCNCTYRFWPGYFH